MTTSFSPRYQPSGDDHLIYEWVKMQGKSQSEVANMFGINQSTVSRIIQRVERWQAHAKARENGRLDPKERLAAQRWLTYERNELIVASCLRIAKEMEGFTELSKSTVSRPIDDPCRKSEIRTEGRTIDRHGVAARFLRLAHRINMDQLKLAALIVREGEALADPLTDEELAAEARQAAADAAEIAAARQQAEDVVASIPLPPGEGGERSEPGEGSQVLGDTKPTSSPLNPESQTLHPSLHNLHNENAPQIAATSAKPCTCVTQVRLDKNSIDTCIIDDKVGRSGPERPGRPVESQLPSGYCPAPTVAGT